MSRICKKIAMFFLRSTGTGGSKGSRAKHARTDGKVYASCHHGHLETFESGNENREVRVVF